MLTREVTLRGARVGVCAFLLVVGPGVSVALCAAPPFVRTLLIKIGGGPFTDSDATAAYLSQYDVILTRKMQSRNIAFQGLNSYGSTWRAIKSHNSATQIHLYTQVNAVHPAADTSSIYYLNNIGRYGVSRDHSDGRLLDHDGYFLHRAGAKLEYWYGGSQLGYYLDPGDPAFQAYVLESALNDHKHQAWAADGIYTDILSSQLSALAPVDEYATQSAWSAGVRSLVDHLTAGFHAEGQAFSINHGNTRFSEVKTHWTGLNAMANPPDYLLEEAAHAVLYGTDSDVQFYSETTWKCQIDTMVALSNIGYLSGASTDLENMADTGVDNFGKPFRGSDAFYFALASHCLGKDEDDAFFFRLGGDSYNSWDHYHAEYDALDLGVALGGYQVVAVHGANIYYREFADGYVYVNPTLYDVSGIPLPEPCKRRTHANLQESLDSVPDQTALDLVSHRGAFLYKSSVVVGGTRVEASADDAEERLDTGNVGLSSTDLEMTREAAGQLVGLRFAGVPVPQGAVIERAYVQFTVDEQSTESTVLAIQGEAADDAPAFSKSDGDLSGRPRTESSVAWTPPAWNTVGAAGLAQRSADLSALVQETVDRPGWSLGNALVLLIGGTGKRVAVSYDGDPAGAPVLSVEYRVDPPLPAGSALLVPRCSVWKYEDTGTDLGTAWRGPGFADTGWAEGRAILGYGEPYIDSQLSYGADPGDKRPTTYFRRHFWIGADCGRITGLSLHARYDDGFVAYLNGQEVARRSLPAGAIEYATAASQHEADAHEEIDLGTHTAALLPRENVLAVELHQAGPTSSDLVMDMELVMETVACPATVAKISKGAMWQYRRGTAEASAPEQAWRAAAFDDSGWAAGAAPFGYGDGPYGTTLADMRYTYSSVFLRREFELEQPLAATAVNLWASYDDGFIMWLNGEELARVNLPGAPGSFVAYTGHAQAAIDDAVVWSRTLSGADMPRLIAGTNVLAVQVFNATDGSSDLTFDAELVVRVGSELGAANDWDWDGMADAWELATLGTAEAAPDADPDGDGHSNLEEYIAGTSPVDETGNWKLETRIQNGEVLVSFDTSPAGGSGYEGLSRHYVLESRASLGDGVWSAVPGYENLAATGATIVHTDPGANASCYRACVWLE